MPSKDNTTSGVTAGVDPHHSHTSIGASDVEDLLVAAIQQKLRLKTRSCHVKQNRTSPYKVPMRTSIGNPAHDMTPATAADGAVVKRCRQCYADLTPISAGPCHQAADTMMCRICSLKTGPKTANNTQTSRRTTTTTTTDPYDLLQELLREGTLIQEAVKRLQLAGLPANKSSTTKFHHYDDYDEISSTASSTTPYEF